MRRAGGRKKKGKVWRPGGGEQGWLHAAGMGGMWGLGAVQPGWERSAGADHKLWRAVQACSVSAHAVGCRHAATPGHACVHLRRQGLWAGLPVGCKCMAGLRRQRPGAAATLCCAHAGSGSASHKPLPEHPVQPLADGGPPHVIAVPPHLHLHMQLKEGGGGVTPHGRRREKAVSSTCAFLCFHLLCR